MRTQRGLAAVELAIIVPVFLMLMMATAELGRAFYTYNALAKAVRDGARYLSMNGLDNAGVVTISTDEEATARNLVVYGNPAGTGTALATGLVTDNVDVAVAGTSITVTVTYDYVPLFAAIPTFGFTGSNLTVGSLTASNTMRAM